MMLKKFTQNYAYHFWIIINLKYISPWQGLVCKYICSILILFLLILCLLETYGPLAPGLTSHWKFADDFLKTCSFSHLSTHSFISRLGWGWFCPSIYELATRSCTHKIVGGCNENYLKSKVWNMMIFTSRTDLLLFPEFLSVGAVTLHEWAQCT